MNQLLLNWVGYKEFEHLLYKNQSKPPAELVDHLNDFYNIKPEIIGEISTDIKSCIFMCTHHSGPADGLAVFAHLFRNVTNFKIVANYRLMVLKSVRNSLVGVYPVSQNRRNVGAKKKMIRHLTSGGSLALYPAGKIGVFGKNGQIKDKDWRYGSASLIREYAKYVVPVYIDCTNPKIYYWVKQLIPSFGFMFSFFFLKHVKKKPVQVKFGSPIETHVFKNMNDQQIIEFVRHRTYQLKDTSHPKEVGL